MAWLEDVNPFQSVRSSVGHTHCSGLQSSTSCWLHCICCSGLWRSPHLAWALYRDLELTYDKAKANGRNLWPLCFFCFCCRSHALLWVGNPGHCVDCTGFGALGSGVWTLANRDFSDYVDRLINYFVSQKTCQHYKDN